jgi:hypothetical protein
MTLQDSHSVWDRPLVYCGVLAIVVIGWSLMFSAR